jgi:hypothetical protein
LLLDRAISPIHGITSITQNIGETENKGLEVIVNSRNLVAGDFNWSTTGNMAYVKNKIVSIYGIRNEEGREIDDVLNNWFVGQPIRVNYNYVMEGVWQLNEADQAAVYGAKPGYIKLKDVNNDKKINAQDRQIIGQQDPTLLWGLTNTFSYRNISLNIFMHGVHGITKRNNLMVDDVYPATRRNTINKNWWTPENPTNEFYMNHKDANPLNGDEGEGFYYEKAAFVRVKDISLAYDFSKGLLEKARLGRLKIFITGRNLFTFTGWHGLDPELEDQRGIPLQKEYVLGLNVGF